MKLIAVVLVLLLIVSSSLFFTQVISRDRNIADLTALSEKQKETIEQLELNISYLRQNLSASEKLLENETQTRQSLEREVINLTKVAKSEYFVIAVDESDKGHLIPLEVVIKSGNGKVLPNIANVLVDETFQSSVQTSILVARDITRTSLRDKDIVINIEAPVQEQRISISGGSAGAAITLAAMAAMQGKTPKKDVLITGTIREDHTIGRIGAPKAKALAARENGAVMFLVPAGQKSEVGNAGIEVIEVRTIEDAAQYVIQT
ncbi:MAG: hypothetical protein OIN88_03955 [Candidatus Methanoperedens sp.]|nr:hypothetical protein [Candidatus Methanoperedens sp.]